MMRLLLYRGRGTGVSTRCGEWRSREARDGALGSFGRDSEWGKSSYKE